MVEIGRRDLLEKGHLRLDQFTHNRSYHGIAMDDHFRENHPLIGQYVNLELIKTVWLTRYTRCLERFMHYYEAGHLHSIPIQGPYQAENCTVAFREMQKAMHIGKFVVEIPGDERLLNAKPVKRSLSFAPDGTYFLIGGLGGLGKMITRWLAKNGARSILFLNRTAGKTLEDQLFVEELRSQGCTVILSAGNVAKREDVERAIRAAPSPIKGVFQSSLALMVGIRRVLLLEVLPS